jgi:hypothetical protein
MFCETILLVVVCGSHETVFFFLLMTMASPCFAADLGGNWAVKDPLPDGTFRTTYLDLHQEGDRITGTIRVYRPAQISGANSRPFGINFFPPGPDPQWIYTGNTDSVVRLPYKNGDLKAQGPAEHIADVPGGDGHWTRDIQFTRDGKKMFVAVGSASNVFAVPNITRQGKTFDVRTGGTIVVRGGVEHGASAVEES